MAVDLVAMEAMLEALQQSSGSDSNAAATCDYTIADRLDRELPQDFEFCLPERQAVLLNKGLYLSQTGEVNPLPLRNNKSAQATIVSIPLLTKNSVEAESYAPFVIDLSQTAAKSGSSLVSLAKKQEEIEALQEKNNRIVRAQPILGCPTFQTFAHRGSPEYPENSIEAVVHALESGHSGVEIDVQQLRDGRWVVHHDLKVGRVSYGQNGLVTNLSTLQWYKVRLSPLKRSQPKNSQAEVKAPFLDDLLRAYSEVASPTQVLNIEVKGGLKVYSCNELTELNKLVSRNLSQRQFLYSSRSIEQLSCLRLVNPNVYLGIVIDPHIASIEATKGPKLSQVQSLYDEIKGDGASKQAYLTNSNRDYLKKTSFKDFKNLIGPYYGFHIDYHDYWDFSVNKNPEKGRLMLYQLGDDAGLVALLNKIKERKEKLPDAVLVDAERATYCGAGS